MNKKFKASKVKTSFLIAAMLAAYPQIAYGGFNTNVMPEIHSGANVVINVNAGDANDKLNDTIYVSTFLEFFMAINKNNSNTKNNPCTIILKNDITIEKKIRIEHSLIIDLNGHKITVKEDKDRIVVGKRTFIRRDKNEKIIPGYWTYVTDVKTVSHVGEYYYDEFGQKRQKPDTKEYKRREVWKPEEKRIEYVNVYEYADTVLVVIKNGEIEKTKGARGSDGVKNTWFDSCGKNGSEPYAPISIISGLLKLEGCTIRGGEGGDGGNGSNTSEWHIPFVTGNGQDGGNGSKGGFAVYIERAVCSVVLTKDSALIGGKGGKGGDGGNASPDYWIMSGSKGKNGQDGARSIPSNNPERISI